MNDILGRLLPISSLQIKTTPVSLPRPVKGRPAFCTERNKEKQKGNRNTTTLRLAWRSYRNEEEKGKVIEEMNMEEGNGQA